MTYNIPNSIQKLIIRNDVLSRISKFRQTRIHMNEAGGQLFATITLELVEICMATGPHKKDERRRCRFRAFRPQEQNDIIKMFKRGLHYVGDWHTHPESYPHPSPVDLDSVKDRFKKSKHSLDHLILVIMGISTEPKGLWVSIHDDQEDTMLVVDQS